MPKKITYSEPESYFNEAMKEAYKKAKAAKEAAVEAGKGISSDVIDTAKLAEQTARFIEYVRWADGNTGPISFRDKSSFLGRNKGEGYKIPIAEKAREALKCETWKESLIGSGYIAGCAVKAINQSGNLVTRYPRQEFKNRLDRNHAKFRPEAERVLFDIYCNPNIDESVLFTNACEVFGAKYEIIAFLYFIKDDSRFLPISSGHFDAAFKILNIDYQLSFNCSWNNYQGFIEIVRAIRDELEITLPVKGDLKLIDAHSFLWVLQEKTFLEWEPSKEQLVKIEKDAENIIAEKIAGTGGKRTQSSDTYNRSVAVAKTTRDRANGICQLCCQPAPFEDTKGNPYLEVHHVIWLSRGGEDSTDNTVALCPNCHRKMHVLNRKEDIEKLSKTRIEG